MTWKEAFEKHSVGGEIATKAEFKEAVDAWKAFTKTQELDPLSKWRGPGIYTFGGYLDENGRGFVTVSRS